MSEPMWSEETYLSFADMATAAAGLGAALGIAIPAEGPFPTGNGTDFALVAPMQAPWQTPPSYNDDASIAVAGVPRPGFWMMLTLDTGDGDTDRTIVCTARMAALAANLQTLSDPPLVFLE